MKLFDVMGGPFVAIPADQLFEPDGTLKVAMANVFGQADPALAHLHNPEPAPVVTQQPEQPQVTTPGRVIPPWELAAMAAPKLTVSTEVLTQGIAAEEAQVTATIPVPWEKPALLIQQVGRALREVPEVTVTEFATQAERGLPDGWGIDNPARLLEVNGSKFANQEDADNWVIAKGRALPFSLKDESRPDPFVVDTMYRWIAEGRESSFLQHRITNFKIACRHAIAVSVLYYDQDVERIESLKNAEAAALAEDECEAARIHWKQTVERRKEQMAILDKEVSDARDAWHALRK